MNLLGIFKTALLAIFFGFIAVFSFQLFRELFFKPNEVFISNAIGAFMGAFFAFLFIRLADFLKAYADRINKGHDTLVKIEYLFNSLLNTLSDNIYLIDSYNDMYRRHVVESSPPNKFVWGDRLKASPLMDEQLPNLLNIDLVNELFSLNVDLRKLNDSIESTQLGYIESKDAFVSGNIDAASYFQNLEILCGKLGTLRGYLQQTTEDTISSLSAVRLLLKKRPLMSRLLKKVYTTRYSQDFEDKRLAEIKKLKQEMENTKIKSRQRIDSIPQGHSK